MNETLNETLDDILEAISETVKGIGRYEAPDKNKSLSTSAALLAVTYKVLSENYYIETGCDDDAEED